MLSNKGIEKGRTDKMKQKRIKSLVMWLGFIATAFLAVGIDWQELTSWYALGQATLDFLKNPAHIIMFAISIYSTANNPTNKTGF